MIPQEFQKFKSYSSYNSYFEDEYKLSDEFFSRVVDGCLICSDTQHTIDIMGNVCLVHPKFGVLHLGKIPRPEVEGEINFSFDSTNNLHIKYRVYYDCDRKHSDIEELIIDTHYNNEVYKGFLVKNLVKYLSTNLRAKYGGCIRSFLKVYRSRENCITLQLNYKKLGYGGRIAKEGCLSQNIVLTDSGFKLLLDANNDDSVQQFITDNISKHLNIFNVENKLVKSTPFMLISYLDGEYRVKDISDGVIEGYTKEQLIEIVNKGIRIVGIDILPDDNVVFRLSK